MASHCIFCNASPTTKEHVFPKWLEPYITQPGDVAEMSSAATSGKARSWRGQPFSHTSRAVCARCNNEWMSRLETSVKGPVSSLVQGRELTLDPFTQVPVAAWVFKTCLVLETTNISGRKLWPEAFRQFRHHKLAPTHAEIWLGTYQHRRSIGRYLASVDTKMLPDGREVTGFRATMAIGAAFFNVFLARDASGAPVTANLHFPEYVNRLTRFSPPNLSFVHPPRGGPLTEAEFENMAVEPAPWSIGFGVTPHASP